jgi:predicted nucleotide-binding protein
MRQGAERLRKRLQEVEGFAPTSVTEQYNIPHVEALAAAVDEALVRTFGADTLDYRRYAEAAQFDNGPHNYAYEVPISEVQQTLARCKARSIALLKQAIATLEERIAESAAVSTSEGRSQTSSVVSKEVFVVHGHDHGARDAVMRFLDSLGLKGIVLSEQPDQGRTIIEKFQAYADRVAFAVVLLTPDDFGSAAAVLQQGSRARQNVVFELGYFVGKLGRGRACLLRKGAVEMPSDLYGVIYTDLDAAEGWKLKLARELKAAGFEIDLNRVV